MTYTGVKAKGNWVTLAYWEGNFDKLIIMINLTDPTFYELKAVTNVYM